MASRAVFLDRDGTMAPDVPYCSRPEDLVLFPTTAAALRRFREHGFKIIVITNQSGVARGYFTEDTLASIHRKMTEDLARGGATLDGIYYCQHHPDDGCECRKPGTLLLQQAAGEHDVDLSRSFVIGDTWMDVQLGKTAGCGTVLIGDANAYDGPPPDEVASDLLEAADRIMGARRAKPAAPRGILIGFSGVDGSGKTTVARRLMALLADEGIPTAYAWGSHEQFFSRPMVALAARTLLPGRKRGHHFAAYERSVNRRLGNPVLSALYRGVVRSEYFFQMLWKVRRPLLMGRNVVADRYVYDLAVNLSVQLGRPAGEVGRMARRLMALLPEPHIVFLVDLPPEEAFRRKGDIPAVGYVRRRRDIYLALAGEFGFVVLDATRSIEEVSRSARDHVLSYLHSLEAVAGT